MQIEKNIFLIGPRACGKTSLGKILATRLGLEFLDTDHVLVENVGMEIADYVDRNGWSAFRDKETETLIGVASSGVHVVGCGGGIVLRPENREILSTGITFYLETAPEELARRLAEDPNEAQRPSLTGKSIVDEVREVLGERAHLYEACADAVLSEGDLEEAVTAAMAALEHVD